jgi:hypothetical protein
MGLDVNAIRFLLDARARAASFETVATIGRQSLHIDNATLSTTLASYGVAVSGAECAQLLLEADGFCEPLLRLLGASEVVSIDVSPYQKASLVHDMNQPIPDVLRDKFSIVLDGGSLEHVFNFPRAINSCMEMLQSDGRFIATTPANNFMGHGFYQFSPELFFRVFNRASGFETERMVIYQDCWPYRWYEVRDPEQIRRRVTLVNSHPTYLLVQARRLESVPMFKPVPQQSDYVVLWDKPQSQGGTDEPRETSKRRYRRRFRQWLYSRFTRLVPKALKDRYHDFASDERAFDPAFYKTIER